LSQDKNCDIHRKGKNMRCPICGEKLIQGKGVIKYQTLCEHVESPNSPVSAKEFFVCSSLYCIANKKKWFWDPMGDFYGDSDEYKNLFDKKMTEALGSDARSIHVEVYKKDENFTFFHIGFFKIRIRYQYKADNDGNVIERKPKFEAWYRQHRGWINYIPGINMLFFCFKSMKSILRRLSENPTNSYIIKEFMSEFEGRSWDKRWWKLLYHFIIKIKYRKLKTYYTAQILLKCGNM
jgi:hypothetical protein